MNCFVRECKTRYPKLNPNLFVHTCFTPLRDVENLAKNHFYTCKVGNKNVHDITHGKLLVEEGKDLEQDITAKILFKVPVYFPSPTRISKMFLIVLPRVQGTYISLKCVKWHLMEIYDIEN